jgi:PAS domain S-box-containing protein
LIPLADVCLFSAFCSLATGVLIYGQNPNHAVNRILLVLCAVVFYYDFTAGFGFLQAVDANIAFQWLRLAAFWYLLPMVLFHTCLVYANVRISKLAVPLIYGPAIMLSLLEGLVAPYEVYKAPWGWDYNYTGYFGNVQALWVIVPSIACLLVLWRRYGTVKSRDEKTGVAIVLCGVLIPVLTGIVTALPFLIGVDLPDLTPPAAAIGFLLVGYAVLKYGIQILTATTAADDILSTMVDTLFLVDTDGKITVTNKAACRLLGFETRELTGRQLNSITQDPGALRVLLGYRFPASLEINLTTKQRSLIPVSVSRSTVFTKRGNLAGYVFICRNITERKQMEGRLAEAQRLAAIGETAAMVGHDLRNPLQAMSGTVYLVKELVGSEKTEDKKETVELLRTLDHTLQYMNKIVSDLQDFAQPLQADPVEVNLPNLVRAAVSSVEIPGNVRVTFDIHNGLPNPRLDPDLFRRVLTNLILNAVQAMPNGGELTIAGSSGEESVIVTVHDTGVGIAPENLGKIFNPFFTTKAQGQGLGLPVCKRLIDAQGGTIDVTSQMGKGSTFTFKIPTNRKLS